MNKLIEIGMSQYAIAEVPGKVHNPEVLKYFRQSGFEYINDDETPWCSGFANWVAMKANFERSSKLNAKSWLDLGKVIDQKDVEVGDVMIFHRGDPTGWQGHVAFYIAEDEKYYHVLGGNQNNCVCIARYAKVRLAGIRRLKDISLITPNED